MAKNTNYGDHWIYQDGELYHYGRKGMKWGETIFGGYDNPKSLTYNPNFGLGRNIGNAVSTVWNNTKGFTSNAAKNFDKYYGREFKKNISSKSNYMNNVADWNRYGKANDYKNIGMTHLEANMAKQIRDGNQVFANLVKNPSIMNKLNLAFQNAQYDIVAGANNILKKLGLDDEVDAILSLFMGNSEARRNSRNNKLMLSRQEDKFERTPVVNRKTNKTMLTRQEERFENMPFGSSGNKNANNAFKGYRNSYTGIGTPASDKVKQSLDSNPLLYGTGLRRKH